MMRFATHFVHPLVEDQTEQPLYPDQAARGTNSLIPVTEEDMEQLPLEELFAHIEPDCLNWLQS